MRTTSPKPDSRRAFVGSCYPMRVLQQPLERNLEEQARLTNTHTPREQKRETELGKESDGMGGAQWTNTGNARRDY